MRLVIAHSRLRTFPGFSDTAAVHALQNIGGVPEEPSETHGALEIAPADDIGGLSVIWSPATDDEPRASEPSRTCLLVIAFVALCLLLGAAFALWWVMKDFTEAMGSLVSGGA
jgi:hypothetical protein